MSAARAEYVVPFKGEHGFTPTGVGGKASGLIEMARADLPVPDGYALTVDAFRQFVAEAGLEPKLGALSSGLTGGPKSVEAVAREMRLLIEGAAMPSELERAIVDAYKALARPGDRLEPAVAVRSSATAEDSDTASFAGEYESFLGIRGADEVLLHVRRCWAGLFNGRALSYAASNDLGPLDVAMGVVVELLVPATRSGVIFTLDPARGDRMKIVIEASYGLGLAIVGGEVTPDRFTVDKLSLDVVDRSCGSKAIEYKLDANGKPIVVETADDQREAFSVSDDEVRALAELAKRVERIYQAPQDIEWAIADDKIVLLQHRPVTAWAGRNVAPAYDPHDSVLDWVTASLRKGVSAN